jgi:hypothetical protein
LSIGKGKIFYEESMPTGVLYTAAEVQEILLKSGMFPDMSQIRAWKTDVVTPFAIDGARWIIYTAAQTGMRLKAIFTENKNFVSTNDSPEEALQFNFDYGLKTGRMLDWSEEYLPSAYSSC